MPKPGSCVWPARNRRIWAIQPRSGPGERWPRIFASMPWKRVPRVIPFGQGNRASNPGGTVAAFAKGKVLRGAARSGFRGRNAEGVDRVSRCGTAERNKCRQAKPLPTSSLFRRTKSPVCLPSPIPRPISLPCPASTLRSAVIPSTEAGRLFDTGSSRSPGRPYHGARGG